MEWPTTLQPLASTLRNYVSSTLKSFSDAGVDLAMVSLGNEIRHGMLWPYGYVDVDTPASSIVANFTNLATLWAAARNGVRDAVRAGHGHPQVMIHLDDGYNLTLQETWYSALVDTGKVHRSDWDIFGFSFYPFYGTAATLANLKTTLNTLAHQYGKPLHVVETDWPAICDGPTAPELSEPSIPASVPGQTEWVKDIIEVVKQVPKGLGQVCLTPTKMIVLGKNLLILACNVGCELLGARLAQQHRLGQCLRRRHSVHGGLEPVPESRWIFQTERQHVSQRGVLYLTGGPASVIEPDIFMLTRPCFVVSVKVPAGSIRPKQLCSRVVDTYPSNSDPTCQSHVLLPIQCLLAGYR